MVLSLVVSSFHSVTIDICLDSSQLVLLLLLLLLLSRRKYIFFHLHAVVLHLITLFYVPTVEINPYCLV
jgi:hypothetical protein